MKRLLAILLLSACTVQAPRIVTRNWEAPPAGSVQLESGLITVLVKRGGPLARLGHDHVIALRQIEGWADLQANRALFRFRVETASVDESALRQEAGLSTQPSDAAIAGTRTNMLDKVLEAAKFPEVVIEARRDGDGLDLAITMHGVTVRRHVAASLTNSSAQGAFTLKQTDFGMTPLSVLGGALVVEDEMRLRFAFKLRTADP